MKKDDCNSAGRFSFRQALETSGNVLLFIPESVLFVFLIIAVSLVSVLTAMLSFFKNSENEDAWKEHQRLSHSCVKTVGEKNDRV